MVSWIIRDICLLHEKTIHRENIPMKMPEVGDAPEAPTWTTEKDCIRRVRGVLHSDRIFPPPGQYRHESIALLYI